MASNVKRKYTFNQLQNWLDRYGSPLFVFDVKEFKDNYFHLLDSFRAIYPKYNIAQSYKTNYTPKICSLVKEYGGLAEVVSDMEYKIAKNVGYSDKDIIYNGPIKGPMMEKFLLDGCVVNIDNLKELGRIINLAKEHFDKELRVGIRVNLDIGQGFVSRFGVDPDNGDLEEVLSQIEQYKNIHLVGLHMHIGHSRGVQYWAERAKQMIELADKYLDFIPEFIDIGSGMFGVMDPFLAEQFGGSIPTYDHYAQAVATVFRQRYGHLPLDKQPWLYTEPGTTIVSAYMYLLSKVYGIKKIRGKNFACIDSCIFNVSDMCRIKKLPIEIYSNGNKKRENFESIDLVGYTCLEYDVPFSEYSGEIGEGDIVLFKNVGGYSLVSKPAFISEQCAGIMINEDQSIELFKRKEKVEDVMLTYVTKGDHNE
ncbi:MAG: diaminopimelate decarboxylase [Clostridiales bacterium]|nr:diaminopimelate decarboxylase [Clostridiales bacterium]